MSEIINTTDSNFEKDINDTKKLVIVDLWAEWCGPCRIMEPILEEIARDFREDVKVVKLNIDLNQETPVKFNIMNIPTLMLFKNGKEIDRIIGAYPKNQLVTKIKNFI